MPLFWRRKNSRKPPLAEPKPAIHVTLEQVKKAVLQFEADMPKGISRKSLLLSDGSLELSRLSRYLGGVSDQKFYLSRETYEIFEEADREIPYYLDIVQVAVDDYIEDRGKIPVLGNSQYNQVDVRLLRDQHYLKELPPFPLYITDQEMLLTHRRKEIM
ncbi:DUF3939 domain-containing protein [Paenibacillus motobuensis]|uniref:DUF3939 domain-containing protein n=1 Tax=Paenibacillus TaxID=44249 RepID=UPI00203D6D54|nr:MULTISPECIES: DUF3939 domain-containing protein [Paenibacillus]MCM3038137.1 DUF3939 domain-containing protein [Paenibacillus lutimineralis]MCM3645241.1 DUF3939 domain-containing protein [Paenibacillus motobuensis]